MCSPWKDKSLIMGLKLGDFSPAIGIATGKGAMGNLADKGLLGIGPRMIATKAQEKNEDKGREAAEREAAAKEAEAKQQKVTAMNNYRSSLNAPSEGMEGFKASSYKKGGKISSASKRADGIALRGKTRA